MPGSVNKVTLASTAWEETTQDTCVVLVSEVATVALNPKILLVNQCWTIALQWGWGVEAGIKPSLSVEM